MNADEQLLNEAGMLAALINHAGYKSYFIGGCVRNHLLGKVINDIDIACHASLEELKKLFPDGREVGRTFPILLVNRQGIDFQIAGFRSEKTGLETARQEDGEKRDFTVNSIYYDPSDGSMIDEVEGGRDIKDKVIRFNSPPEDRISEDPQRLIRAVRLAVECEFDIEAQSLAMIKANAFRIKDVAAERIISELDKLWFSRNPERGLRLLDETGLLEQLLPEVAAQKGVEQPPVSHPEGDCFEHTCLTLRYMPKPASRYLAWAAVLHDIGKPVTRQKGGKISFPGHALAGADMAASRLIELKADNDLIRHVYLMIARHGQFGKIDMMKKAELKRIMARPTFEDELDLHYADKMAGNKKLDKNEKARRRAASLADEPNTLEKAFSLINGHDLNEFGLIPGPIYRAVLQTVHDAYLEGDLTARDEALALAEKLVGEYTQSRQS